MTHRTFNKAEIGEIFAKATEFQSNEDNLSDENGLTESELIQIAKEMGIPTNSIRNAINIIDSPYIENTFSWKKGNSKIRESIVFDGELTEKDWEKIVQDIRGITFATGEISKTGSTFEWSEKGEFANMHLTLTPEKGTTILNYIADWRTLKFLISFLPAFLGTVITLIAIKGLGFDKATAVMLSPVGGLLGFSSGWLYLKSIFQTQKNTFHKLKNTISQKLSFYSQQSVVIESEEIYNVEEKDISKEPIGTQQ